MRNTALIAIALLSLPVHAGKVTTFNEHCVESESVIASMNAQPAQAGKAPTQAKLELIGEACQYGQLTREDISFVESVQPANAIRLIAGQK